MGLLVLAPLDPFCPLPARGCGPFPLVFKKIAHPAATPPALTFYNSLPASKKCGGSRPRMLCNRNKQLPNCRRTARASRRRLTPRRLCTHPRFATVALLGKHGLSIVDDITFALVKRLTGNELDAIHKFTIGKAAKGNVAEKRAAVAAVLGMQQAVQRLQSTTTDRIYDCNTLCHIESVRPAQAPDSQ